MLDTPLANSYNNLVALLPAEVAQVVEQRTENPRVVSSTLTLGTRKRLIWQRACLTQKALKSRVVHIVRFGKAEVVQR